MYLHQFVILNIIVFSNFIFMFFFSCHLVGVTSRHGSRPCCWVFPFLLFGPFIASLCFPFEQDWLHRTRKYRRVEWQLSSTTTTTTIFNFITYMKRVNLSNSGACPEACLHQDRWGKWKYIFKLVAVYLMKVARLR